MQITAELRTADAPSHNFGPACRCLRQLEHGVQWTAIADPEAYQHGRRALLRLVAMAPRIGAGPTEGSVRAFLERFGGSVQTAAGFDAGGGGRRVRRAAPAPFSATPRGGEGGGGVGNAGNGGGSARHVM